MVKILKPTVVIDREQCLKNIHWAVAKARKEKVALRPHFKTHQSRDIGEWFRSAGVDRITVSSLTMAEYFAAGGWKDIMLAIPINIAEADGINTLASECALSVFVADPVSVRKAGQVITAPLTFFIEIDTGQNRSGLDPLNRDDIDSILDELSTVPNFIFGGFASHAGHSYSIRGNQEALNEIHRRSKALLAELKEAYSTKYPGIIISAGDTPTFSVSDSFHPLDEVRPGNLVFYDLTQVAIGSCTLEQIAVSLHVPVISVKAKQKQLVIYGGAVHLSKDFLQEKGESVHYGMAFRSRNGKRLSGEAGMYIRSLSQEHGVIDLGAADPSGFSPGDILVIMPVHSCLMCDLAKSYVSSDGEVLGKM